MRTSNVAALAVISLLIAGCAGSPEVEMSTPASVIVSGVKSKQNTEALQLAETECQKYGKHAVILNFNKSERTATYECKS